MRLRLGGLLGAYLGLVPTPLVGSAVGLLAVGWVLAGSVRLSLALQQKPSAG